MQHNATNTTHKSTHSLRTQYAHNSFTSMLARGVSAGIRLGCVHDIDAKTEKTQDAVASAAPASQIPDIAHHQFSAENLTAAGDK